MASKTSKSTKTTKPVLAAVHNDDTSLPVAEKSGPTVTPPLIAVVSESDDMEDGPVPKGDAVKMKELLAAVVAKTGAKKKDAKDVVDAVLAEMAAALTAGKSLSLPPLGNLRVAKTQEKDGAMLLALKLRIGPDSGSKARIKGAKDALAADGEDS
jgi:DNA-binding protein HU-alpha